MKNCTVEEQRALKSLPRLADGAIAYPGRNIWTLKTKDAGKTWTPAKCAIAGVSQIQGFSKLMRLVGDEDVSILTTYLRYYATKKAALADVPNHVML